LLGRENCVELKNWKMQMNQTSPEKSEGRPPFLKQEKSNNQSLTEEMKTSARILL